MFRSVTLIALVASVAAQSISDGCRNTLASLAVNSDVSACLNTPALLPLISGNSSSSLVPAIDNWLTGFCSAPVCSNATIASVIDSLASGCSADLGDESGPVGVDETVALAQNYFPTLRRVLCLKQGDDHCTIEALEDIESTVGPLTLQSVATLFLSPPASLLQPNVSCTDCTKQAYNIIVEAVPETATSFGPIAQNVCGASFVDGANVSGVTESASSQTAGSSTNDNGVAGLFSAGGIAVSGIAVVSSVFTLLV